MPSIHNQCTVHNFNTGNKNCCIYKCVKYLCINACVVLYNASVRYSINYNVILVVETFFLVMTIGNQSHSCSQLHKTKMYIEDPGSFNTCSRYFPKDISWEFCFVIVIWRASILHFLANLLLHFINCNRRWASALGVFLLAAHRQTPSSFFLFYFFR